MHLDGLWDIWRAAVFFYIYFWTLQKSTAATAAAAAYINTVMFFCLALPRFCVFPLIDATSILLI